MLIPEGRRVRETKQGKKRREGKKEKHILQKSEDSLTDYVIICLTGHKPYNTWTCMCCSQGIAP